MERFIICFKKLLCKRNVISSSLIVFYAHIIYHIVLSYIAVICVCFIGIFEAGFRQFNIYFLISLLFFRVGSLLISELLNVKSCPCPDLYGRRVHL